MKDTYKEVRTFYRDGVVVRVHIPDITKEERARRMREIEKAAAMLLASKKQ
jgi:ribosome recycling factor